MVECRALVAAVFACALSFGGSARAQGGYGPADAEYVTTSRDPEVLRYVVCLERAVGLLPRNVALADALSASEATCFTRGARLPHAPNEPDTAAIRDMILECGFRPGDASADSGCGAPARQGGQAPRGAIATPRVIALGKNVEGITHDGHRLWATESGQRTVAEVDLRGGRVIARHKVGRLPLDVLPDPRGGVMVLLGTDDKIVGIGRNGDLSTLAPLSGCPTQMVAQGLDIYVLGQPDCSSNTTAVTRVDGTSGVTTVSADLGEWGQAMLARGRDLWVGHARGGVLDVLDARSLRGDEIALPGLEIWSMAADDRSIFAAGRRSGTEGDGVVVMIDARSRREVGRHPVTELVLAMGVDGDDLIVVGEKGSVWVLSASDLSPRGTLDLGMGTFRTHTAMVVDGALVVSAQQVQGENGAVFVVDDYRSLLGSAGARPRADRRTTDAGRPRVARETPEMAPDPRAPDPGAFGGDGEEDAPGRVPSRRGVVPSVGGSGPVTRFTLVDDMPFRVTISWIDGGGKESPAGDGATIEPGQSWRVENGAKGFESHWYSVRNRSGVLCSFALRQDVVVKLSDLDACRP